MDAKMLWPGVLTRLMACLPTAGAAAAIIAQIPSPKKHGLTNAAHSRPGHDTDRPVTFGPRHARSGRIQLAQAAANRWSTMPVLVLRTLTWWSCTTVSPKTSC
jgi:hypothetical protein